MGHPERCVPGGPGPGGRATRRRLGGHHGAVPCLPADRRRRRPRHPDAQRTPAPTPARVEIFENAGNMISFCNFGLVVFPVLPPHHSLSKVRANPKKRNLTINELMCSIQSPRCKFLLPPGSYLSTAASLRNSRCLRRRSRCSRTSRCGATASSSSSTPIGSSPPPGRTSPAGAPGGIPKSLVQISVFLVIHVSPQPMDTHRCDLPPRRIFGWWILSVCIDCAVF